MTKGQMMVAIYDTMKWAKQNDKEAFEDIKCKLSLEGIYTSENLITTTKKTMRLRKDDLMHLMCEVVECIY